MRSIKFRMWHKELGQMLEVKTVTFDQMDGPLMQYTGIKDRNGTEVYEKDVVQFVHPSPNKSNRRPVINMVVSWSAKRAQWGMYWRSLKGDLLWQSLGSHLDENHTVVGNAYQNPELLK